MVASNVLYTVCNLPAGRGGSGDTENGTAQTKLLRPRTPHYLDIDSLYIAKIVCGTGREAWPHKESLKDADIKFT